MHVEKNICESLLGTILNLDSKTKDHLNSRLDLQLLNIRKELHPIEVGDKFELRATCYSMSLQEKNTMLKMLKEVKVLDGYSSNISRCIDLKQRKISQLKSHDCHVLMQELLLAALLHSFSREVCFAIIKLCTFFKTMCLKDCCVSDFHRME